MGILEIKKGCLGRNFESILTYLGCVERIDVQRSLCCGNSQCENDFEAKQVSYLVESKEDKLKSSQFCLGFVGVGCGVQITIFSNVALTCPYS